MRAVFIGLALAFMALPVSAQTRAQNVARCVGGDPDASIAGCTALIQSGQETSADLAVDYYNRGIAYNAKGLRDQAIADFTQAIARNPQFAYAYGNRGVAYYAKGHDQAIADFTQAIARNPQYAAAYINRGTVYEDKGLHDLAIADYTKAIELNPQDASLYTNRGAAYEAKGLHDHAIADYRAALKMNPTNQKALDGLKRLGATP